MFSFATDEIFRDQITVGKRTLNVVMQPEKIAPTYFKLIRQLTLDETNLAKDPMTYSQHLIELMTAVLGLDNTKIMLDEYKDDYQKMVNDFVFYSTAKIAPVMREASKRREKLVKEQKRAMRKASWRRWFHL